MALRARFWPYEIIFDFAEIVFGLVRSVLAMPRSFLALRDRFWPCKIDFWPYEIVFGLARSILGFEEIKTNSNFVGKKSGFVDSGFVKKL